MQKLEKKYNQNAKLFKGQLFNKKTKHLYANVYSNKKGRPSMKIERLSDLSQIILMFNKPINQYRLTRLNSNC